MINLGLSLGAVARRSSVFHPASLFTLGSDYGLVMDVASHRMSVSGTTQATPGQTVTEALFTMYDGNGANSAFFQQETAGSRPTFSADGDLRYLQFDGSSDWMYRPSNLDMGAKDAVTVIAGLRRGQSANMEDLIGVTTNPPGNAGTWRMCPTFDAASDNAAFASRGAGSDAGARAAGTLVGNTYVLTGEGDISADLCRVRRNGVVQASSVTDQGTGNYINGPLYLGSRGGTARFFNGRLYALVVINRLLSAQELAAAEQWVASKSGVTL